MKTQLFPPLIYGFDTVEIAYYLTPSSSCSFDFDRLVAQRDSLKSSGLRHLSEITIGSEDFGLASHGTKSGYPLLLSNESFTVQCGEYNVPSFFVTYSSLALWHEGIESLHKRFLFWANGVGLEPIQPESISRADYAVDFHLPVMDFEADDFVTQAVKDSQHRGNRQVQTFRIGRDATVLRVYNKSEEIQEQSGKYWLHPLWGYEDDVWRIEFQSRKETLKEFGIKTLEDLLQKYGVLLSYLAHEHTRLTIPSEDTNRSRWQTHPLWESLQVHFSTLPIGFNDYEFNRDAHLDARLERCFISILGYAKRISAIKALQGSRDSLTVEETLDVISRGVRKLYEPLTWQTDVAHRMAQMRLGQ